MKIKRKELKVERFGDAAISDKNGDGTAFDMIYQETHKQIYKTIGMMVYDWHDREDIMNEVYTQMWSSYAAYDLNLPFQAWIYGITIRQIRSYKRKNWRFMRILEKEKSFMHMSEKSEEEHKCDFDAKEDFLSMIAKLPDKQKEVIILRYYHEYPFETISNILGISLGTAKSRHRLALDKLRKQKNIIVSVSGGYCNEN